MMMYHDCGDHVQTHEAIFKALTAESAVDWRHVGRAIAQLDSISQVSPDGRTWIDVLQEHLKQIGQPISTGHLHKVRRAYNFLTSGLNLLDLPAEREALAKVSSIETAERLYQHDPKAGLDALAACLDPRQPATLADVQSKLREYIQAHPERKTPMQAAWERRRESAVLQHSPTPVPDYQKAETKDFQNLLEQMSEYVMSLSGELHAENKKALALEGDLAETEAALEAAKQELANAVDEITRLKTEILRKVR